MQKPVHKENLNLPKTAQDVYEYIGNEPVHIDKISADLKIPVFKVLTALTMLEMKDLVSALQGRNYKMIFTEYYYSLSDIPLPFYT